MSDAAVIRFWKNNHDEHPLGLYLHWGGGQYAEALATALKVSKGRWDDEDYANRMAVQTILEFVGVQSGDLGAGLFTGIEDRGEEHPILNVVWEEKVVWTDDWRVSFDSFIVSPAMWEALQA